MPYRNKAKNDACKRRWDETHKAETAERKKRRYWNRVDITRANENERNWRMGMHARATPEVNELIRTMTVVNMRDLQAPQFIFVLGGKRCWENLYSPLPSFSSRAR
jgi:hypothetical protein